MYSSGLMAWMAACSPLLMLLLLMVILRMKAWSASLIAWGLAMAVAVLRFGATPFGILVACGKGLALALFVVLIVWSAVLLYNVVKHAGAIRVISAVMMAVTSNRLLQLLLLAWCFSSFIQGIAGFGVPVAVAAPLLVGIGFPPILAASAAMIGHAWSVTYGSMAASYFSLQLVVSVPPAELNHWLGILFLLPIFICGLSVAHMHGGFRDVRAGLPAVFLSSVVMGAALIAVTRIGAEALGTLASGAAGVVVIVLYARLSRFGCHGGRSSVTGAGGLSPMVSPGTGKMGILTATAPYLFLVVTVSIFQIPRLRDAVSGIGVGFSFPATVTAAGYETAAVSNYAMISLFGHPAPFLTGAALLGVLFYRRRGALDGRGVRTLLHESVVQCGQATISTALMVMMALVMNDAGMTSLLANETAAVSGRLFPLLSPFIGVLGSFMTGSNSSSNVLFGAFQEEVALRLGVSAAVLVSAQSVGGSLGSAIAPAKALIGAATVGIPGQEGAIIRHTLLYCLLNAAATGILVALVVYAWG